MEDLLNTVKLNSSSSKIQVTKRVLTDQSFKKIPSFTNHRTEDEEIVQVSKTPTKARELHDSSTSHSKKSSFLSSANKRSTPSQRLSKDSENFSTPVKTPSPVKPFHRVEPASGKLASNPSIQALRQDKPARQSPLKHHQRTSDDNTLSSQDFILTQSKPSRDSNPKLVKNRDQGADWPANSYDPRIQRQKIFNDSFEFHDFTKVHQPSSPLKNRLSETSASGFIKQLPAPSIMKQQELSTFDIKAAPQEVEIYEIVLNQIPSFFSDLLLRDLLEGFHIIYLALDTDNLSGYCKGTGRIKMRSNYYSDVELLQAKLYKQGIEAVVDTSNKARKNDFTDFFTENWRKSPSKANASPSRAREAKLRSLESSIFS